MSSSLETSSFWNQSTSGHRMHVIHFPDVVHVLSKSFTVSCNSGSIVLPPECSSTAQKYRKCLEELGFKQYWNLFFGPPPFARVDIQSPINHRRAPTNFFFLNSSRISPNLTAQSSSWWTDWSCRSSRIMAFDTTKQSWWYFSGLTSILFLQRGGIETEVNVTAGFSRGLALATSFPAALCSSPSMVSVVSVTYFSIPFTIRTQEAVRPEFQYHNDLDGDKLYVQDWAIFVVLRIQPLARVLSSFRGIVYSRHKWCICCPSSASSVMKNCTLSTVFKPASEHSLDNFWW